MTMHLILNMASSHEWPGTAFQRIPPGGRPTVVHCARVVAEAEALRLKQANPEGDFVVFRAVARAINVDEPTHLNMQGKVLRTARVARIAEIE